MSDARPIIIKKIKKGGGDGHHGGAWKVAYADFVTAMMAFFLLMWLLNATSEDQRKGLADFFDPSIPISRNSAGGAGMLNGDTANAPPDAASTEKEGERPKMVVNEESQQKGTEDFSPEAPEGASTAIATGAASGDVGAPENGDGGAAGAAGTAGQGQAPSASDIAQMEDVVDKLLAEVQAQGQDGLIKHFSMRITPEGLLIEIGDLQGEPLFGSGSAAPAPILPQLIDILAPVLQGTTNDIAVVGHTDGRPFTSRRGYTNWELSADRANAARRLFAEAGLETSRIVRISGRAATEPLVADPNAARNRRIAITLLRENRN